MMEYYSTIKNNETLPFMTIQMGLEGIVLSKVSQTDENKYHMISLICGISQRHVYGYREQIGGCQWQGQKWK